MNKSDVWIPNKFEKQEAKDFDYFMLFAQAHKSRFATVSATTYGCKIDVACRNITGGTYAVEIKQRKDYNVATKYPDCYIEPLKWNTMRGLWNEHGIMPLYFNFIGDGAHPMLYLWVLNTIPEENIRYQEHVRFQSVCDKPGEKSGDETRICIRWEDATKFEWINGRYVITQHSKLKSTEPPKYIEETKFKKIIDSLYVEDSTR